MIKYRERRKKEEEENQKPTTRKDVEEHEKQRAKWREQKQRYRANLMPFKKAWINKKRKEKRTSVKQQKEEELKNTLEKQTAALMFVESLQRCNAPMDTCTPEAKRKALSRARKAEHGQQSTDSNPEGSTAVCCHCSHSTPLLHRGRKWLSNIRASQLHLQKAVEYLRNKEDIGSRQIRRIMLQIFEKYGSLHKRTQILKMNKKTALGHVHPKEGKRIAKSHPIQEEVKTFFEGEAVPLPNKKQVSKKSGLPSFVLQKPLTDCYKDFKDRGAQTSFSKFVKCRPKNVRQMAATGLNQCLCEYCVNADLKIQTYNKLVNSHQRIHHIYHAVSLSTCEGGGKTCSYRECGNCNITKLGDFLKPAENVGQVTWHRWTSKTVGGKQVPRKVLETRRGTSTDLIQEFLQETSFLSEHLFRAKWQHQQFEYLRNLSPLPSSLLMMVLDFAKNFACSTGTRFRQHTGTMTKSRSVQYALTTNAQTAAKWWQSLSSVSQMIFATTTTLSKRLFLLPYHI